MTEPTVRQLRCRTCKHWQPDPSADEGVCYSNKASDLIGCADPYHVRCTKAAYGCILWEAAP